MTINKQALRESAVKSMLEEGVTWWDERQLAHEDGVLLHQPDAAFVAMTSPATVLALLDELETANALNKHLELANRKAEGCSEALRRKTEAAEKRIAALESDIKSANERYENRAPTEWAYNQACAAIEKHRLRADNAEAQLAELVAAGIITKVGE